MVKDNLLKIIEQYKKYTFIQATKNLVYHVLTREYKKSFGTLNPEKIFYVIRSIDDKSKFYIGPKNNLLANYFYVLSHIQYAINNGWIPIVDQLNYPVYNSVDFPINGTMNAWEYYWKQPCNYTLEEVYRSKNVVLSKQNWFSEYDMGYDIEKYYNKNNIRNFYLLSQKVPLNIITRDYVNYKYQSIFEPNKKILGVSYRYVGYSKDCYYNAYGHPIQPDLLDLVKYSKEVSEIYQMDYIFLATDEETSINLFKHYFGNKLFFLPRERYVKGIVYGKNNPISIYSNKKIYNTTLMYLVEMEILSKCNGLLGSITSGLRYAIIRNNNKYEILKILDNGLFK